MAIDGNIHVAAKVIEKDICESVTPNQIGQTGDIEFDENDIHDEFHRWKALDTLWRGVQQNLCISRNIMNMKDCWKLE